MTIQPLQQIKMRKVLHSTYLVSLSAKSTWHQMGHQNENVFFFYFQQKTQIWWTLFPPSVNIFSHSHYHKLSVSSKMTSHARFWEARITQHLDSNIQKGESRANNCSWTNTTSDTTLFILSYLLVVPQVLFCFNKIPSEAQSLWGFTLWIPYWPCLSL